MQPWSLAVPDWRDRIRTGRSLLPDLPHLNRAQANRAVAIFNKLRLPDVIGTPALSEAGADWFREIVGALHGSFDPVARERMIREIFLLAPKKSSKTSYAAALSPVRSVNFSAGVISRTGIGRASASAGASSLPSAIHARQSR
jgi:phage terminase large subunit-like protein